jgi:hypothetical protein
MKCENTSYSAMLYIAESIPPPESIPPIPELYPTQFHSIPELHPTQFHSISESISTIPVNSIRFRNRWNWFRILNWAELVGIPSSSGIAGTDSGLGILSIASSLIQFRNWWNWFRNCWVLIAPIPGLNGIDLDGIPESMELIPQCSTSRNRMTALTCK